MGDGEVCTESEGEILNVFLDKKLFDRFSSALNFVFSPALDFVLL